MSSFNANQDNDAPDGSNGEPWLMGWSEHSATRTPTNFVFHETNEALVNELQKNVNFKRAALIKTSREIASAFDNMRSTVQAVDAIRVSR